jgi:CheY-like chemotaxis protein
MAEQHLNGWKEIASYLGRGIRTVQRWEADLGLPVRRPRGKDRSAVVALASELDLWLVKAPSRVFDDQIDGDSVGDSPVAALPMRVLVVEDSVADVHSCVSLLRRLRVKQVDVLSSVSAAVMRLEEISQGLLPIPDIMILDLNFSSESGFEVLRFWKDRQELKSMRIIVWTAMGETERLLSDLFGVEKVVPKWAGIGELETALRGENYTAADLTPQKSK